MGPGALSSILDNLPNVMSDKLMVGFDTSDDACVYKLTDEIAAIHTVDFFTPIVDDPFLFGQIAASNSLSDVYAMGGYPALAMNILCIPNCLPLEVTRKILEGGHSKAVEAGCIIAGGHTIEDDVPKYGMCVTGYVHPDKVLRNCGAEVGDLLVVTKPIGSGVISTAAKVDMADKSAEDEMIMHLVTLNKRAAEAVVTVGDAHACTDITGFGLLGHGYEMAAGGDTTLVFDTKKVPYMTQSPELAQMGMIPGGAYRNLDYVAPYYRAEPGVPQWCIDLMADPQTAGGLLVAMPPEKAHAVVDMLKDEFPWVAIVGEVIEKQDVEVILK